MQNIQEEIALADQGGVDVFGFGERQRNAFVDPAPVVILGAATTLMKNIRLTSTVIVLGPPEPVRVF